jgi:hypothetical protein
MSLTRSARVPSRRVAPRSHAEQVRAASMHAAHLRRNARWSWEAGDAMRAAAARLERFVARVIEHHISCCEPLTITHHTESDRRSR